MSRWSNPTWDARRAHPQPISFPVPNDYELLCDEAQKCGVHIELFMFAGEAVELGLTNSNGKSLRVPLCGLDDLPRAAGLLLRRVVKNR